MSRVKFLFKWRHKVYRCSILMCDVLIPVQFNICLRIVIKHSNYKIHKGL